MEEIEETKGKGWRGDPEGHARAGHIGGCRNLELYGRDYYRKMGSEGGKKHSIEHFREAGRKGGLARAERYRREREEKQKREEDAL